MYATFVLSIVSLFGLLVLSDLQGLYNDINIQNLPIDSFKDYVGNETIDSYIEMLEQ